MITQSVRRTSLPLLLFLLVWSWGVYVGMAQPSSSTVVAPPAVSRHLLLGNPSNATAHPSDANNFLLEKPQFILSYHNINGTPNWVSWHLQKSDLGPVVRKDDFHPDPALPRHFKRVLPRDYGGSRFDRGHMCNSEDRTRTATDN